MVRNAHHSSSRRVILDGEMLAYDPQQGIFLEFGTLKDAAKRDIRNDRLPHPCCNVQFMIYPCECS